MHLASIDLSRHRLKEVDSLVMLARRGQEYGTDTDRLGKPPSATKLE